MENKKRRNSILKKPPTNDEDTTGEITTKIKRRISFSGKKSVKEFIPGEEEATIWGTSYEESAECLQANSGESGLVNVQEKRIVLRNRRVVVDPNREKKRRSKKKVFIAENDKENILVQPELVHPSEVKTFVLDEPAAKVESPVRTELALVKSHCEDAKTQTMSKPFDCVNICSNTFDFINYSGEINKSITIERSVDVTLNENELQMFKFQVPIVSSARDGSSPNIFSQSILMSEEDVKLLKMVRGKNQLMSVTETEPHVLISMTHAENKRVETITKPVDMEAEMAMGQTIRENSDSVMQSELKRRDTIHMNQSISVTNCEVPKTNIFKRKTITKVVDMDKVENGKDSLMGLLKPFGSGTEYQKRLTVHMNQSMDVSRYDAAETKNLKRKTISKAVSMEEKTRWSNNPAKSLSNVIDCSSMDINSPLRRKTRFDYTNEPIDLTDVTVENGIQEEPFGRQTIHFESAVVEESLICTQAVDISMEQSIAAPRSSRQTIHFNCPVEVDKMDNNSMELSACEINETTSNPSCAGTRLAYSLELDTTSDIQQSAPRDEVDEEQTAKGRQTIHFAKDGQMDFTMDISKGRPAVVPREQTTMRIETDMNFEGSPQAMKPIQASSRQTIHASVDIVEETLLPCSAPKVVVKKRESICTPTDIIEDSPRPTKPAQSKAIHHDPIRTCADIADYSSLSSTSADIIEDSPKATKIIQSPVSNVLKRQTIYSTDIVVESPPRLQSTFSFKQCESIYTPADILEDSPKVKRSTEGNESNVQRRQALDMAKVSQPTKQSFNASVKQRQSIYAATDMLEDSPKVPKSTKTNESNVNRRQTTYNPADITLDSPKAAQSTISFLKESDKQRQSIYTATDMLEDSPKVPKSTKTNESNVNRRQTTCNPVDITLDSPKAAQSRISSLKDSVKERQSIYTATDVLEESPKVPKSTKTNELNVNRRQTTYNPADITLDSPKAAQSTISFLKESVKQRQSIYTATDMLEDSPKVPKSTKTNESNVNRRQTTYNPVDITPDSPKTLEFTKSSFRESVNKHQSIYTAADIVEDSPKSMRSNALQRPSIYEPSDVIYDSLREQPPPPESATLAPKVIVKHLNLQQCLPGVQAALRISKDPPSKMKPEMEIKSFDTSMDMSLLDEPSNKLNFRQLNEMIWRGEAKAFSEPRKENILFGGRGILSSNVVEVGVKHTLPRLSSKDCEIEQSTNSPLDEVVSKDKRQTIHFNREIDLDDTEKPRQEDSMDLSVAEVSRYAPNKSKRQTIHFSEELEEEIIGDTVNRCQGNQSNYNTINLTIPRLNQVSALEETSLRTINFNQNQELEGTRTEARNPLISKMDLSTPKEGRTVHGHYNVERLPSKCMSAQRARDNQTQQQDDDTMDLCTIDCHINDQQKESLKRRTIHVNQDLEVEDINEQRASERPSLQNIYKEQMVPQTSNTSKRYTVHLNQPMEFDEVDQQIALFNETQRNTVENALRKHQTVYFHQNDDLEESTRDRQGIIQAKQDDSIMNMSVADEAEQNLPKVLPKPRRLTIIDNQCADVEESPQKFTARKSGFSRTLNFNEIQTATRRSNKQTEDDMDVSIKEQPTTFVNEDSPLCYFNAKSKAQETTPEIDRSLAEYLKVEAAATLIRSNTHEMDMDGVEDGQKGNQTVYCDIQNETFEEQQLKSKPEPVNIFEESGMQPLQQPALRWQTTLPSDEASNHAHRIGDRSRLTRHTTFELKDMIQDMPAQRTYENKDRDTIETLEVARPNEQASYQTITKGSDQFLEPIEMMEETHVDVQSNSRNSLYKVKTLVDMQPNRLNLQATDKTRSEQRTTDPKPVTEECENSMEISMLSEKHPKSEETSRKTIHFTNENAVDESFFDEKLSKATVSQNPRNRKTVFFNETENAINDMEVTLSVNKPKSKAVQNMKEILLESNRLFTQSNILKPPNFESKRAVTASNENMDCESPRRSKVSKCRIPQLIDSAKKLQSMKKSMEFIQQNLPNLACSMEREDTPQKSNIRGDSSDAVETARRIAATVRKNLQEAFNEDIARRVTTFEPRELRDSIDTIEIPRTRDPTHESRQMQESFDTVEIPRRATVFQRNDTMYHCPNEMDATNVSQKSVYKFEDAPITISDVSEFLAQKPILTSQPENETFSMNTTETLCNLDVQLPKSSDSDDTAYNFDKFKERYVELTCDSVMLSGLREDIEKTHLSLVNSLDEVSEVVPPVVEAELPKVAQEIPTSKQNSSVCRKCKRHRLSVTQNDSTIGSFMLEPMPMHKMDLDVLQDLGSMPKISDVAKVWRQKMRESDSFTSDRSQSMALDESGSVDEFIVALENERLVAAQQRQRKEIKTETSFVHRVWKEIQSKKSNWILNELLLSTNVLRFTHKRLRTFAIFITFTPKDPRGIEVNFNEIQLVPNVLHTRQWKPFDYALHYQLLVELPFDLRSLCATSENLFQMLEHVDEVSQDVLKTGRDMFYLVLTSPASLIRESSGSIYIRKYARMKTQQNEVKITEFLIEVRNIKKLSYESIVTPPLYEFDEKIQLLPVGQDFLRVFLANPMLLMKE